MARKRVTALAEWIPTGTVKRLMRVCPARLLYWVSTGRVRCLPDAKPWPLYSTADIQRAALESPKRGVYRDRRRPPVPSVEVRETGRTANACRQELSAHTPCAVASAAG